MRGFNFHIVEPINAGRDPLGTRPPKIDEHIHIDNWTNQYVSRVGP
jgi:hypothetical protein